MLIFLVISMFCYLHMTFTLDFLPFNFRKLTGGYTCPKPNTASSTSPDSWLPSTCSHSSGAAASWQLYENQGTWRHTVPGHISRLSLFASSLSFLSLFPCIPIGGLCNKSYVLVGGLPTHSHGVSIDADASFTAPEKEANVWLQFEDDCCTCVFLIYEACDPSASSSNMKIVRS